MDHTLISDRLARLPGRVADHAVLRAAGAADAAHARRARHLRRHVQRVHGRRGAVAGLRLAAGRMADHHRQRGDAGAGGDDPGDQAGRRVAPALPAASAAGGRWTRQPQPKGLSVRAVAGKAAQVANAPASPSTGRWPTARCWHCRRSPESAATLSQFGRSTRAHRLRSRCSGRSCPGCRTPALQQRIQFHQTPAASRRSGC